MAKIKHRKKEINVKNNEEIREACKKLGVQFGCNSGSCGTCIIKVKKGQENLSEHAENEKRFGLDKNHRLACQCRIKKGAVEIDF